MTSITSEYLGIEKVFITRTQRPSRWKNCHVLQLKTVIKIFTNHITDTKLISKIYKELLQLNWKKRNTIKNGQRTWTNISPKKTFNDQLVYEKTQMKMTMGYHLTSVRMSNIKKVRVGEHVKKSEPLCRHTWRYCRSSSRSLQERNIKIKWVTHTHTHTHRKPWSIDFGRLFHCKRGL